MAAARRHWEVALGGSRRLQQRRWVEAAAEEHAIMVSASALSKPRATVTMLVSASARTA
jgi:hypothetical protein